MRAGAESSPHGGGNALVDKVTPLIKDAKALIKRRTGFSVNTQYWVADAEVLLKEMQLSHKQILDALNTALGLDFHRAKILDRGLSWLKINYYEITAVMAAPQPRIAPPKYKEGWHERWEAETHIWTANETKARGERPALQEIQRFSEAWTINNWAVHKMATECPVCVAEIAGNAHEEPFKRLRLIIGGREAS